ncbi:MAG: Ig-like domain-containing protein, partial [bacterium]
MRAERVLLALLLAGGAAAGAPLYSRAETAPAKAAFTVEAITPGPRDMAVPRNVAVTVRFSAEPDPATVTPERMRIEGVAARIEVSGAVVFLKPSAPLPPGTRQKVTVGAGIADRSGTLLSAPASGEFGTGAALFTAGVSAVPVASSRTELFRYPYLQVHGPGSLTLV